MRIVALVFLILLALSVPAGAHSQGWYLLRPPLSAAGQVDASAPLTRWTVAAAFDSAPSCQARLSLSRELQEVNENLIRQAQEDKRRWLDKYGAVLRNVLRGAIAPPDEGERPDPASPWPELFGQWRHALTTVEGYTPIALNRGEAEDLIPLLRRMYRLEATVLLRAEIERELVRYARCLPTEALPPGMK